MFPCEMARYIAGFSPDARILGLFVLFCLQKLTRGAPRLPVPDGKGVTCLGPNADRPGPLGVEGTTEPVTGLPRQVSPWPGHRRRRSAACRHWRKTSFFL